jgi:uncharacterized protein (DUF885 family)
MRYAVALLGLLALNILVRAQGADAGKAVIEKALKDIREFRKAEQRRDSMANHPLGSNTEADYLRRYQFYKSVDKRLQSIDKNKLAFADEINLELLEYDIEDDVSSYEFKSYLNPILSDEGFHTGLPGMGNRVLNSKKDCDDYLASLKDIPRYVGEHLELMRTGLKLGICQPAVILDGYQNTYEQQIVDSPEKSVFYKPFARKPATISDEDWRGILSRANRVIRDDVVGAFRQMKIFFDTEYLPGTRKTIGVSNFPNGLAYYQDRVHHYTTTDISYEVVFQLGLREVARIQQLMENVKKEVQFKGSMQEFIAYLRSEPRFYATTPEQLLKEASFIAKKIDGKLPTMFGKLPRQPYGVEPVPAHLAPTYTSGRYSGSPISSKRAGHYWVNTYDLRSRPLYALAALTMHEAVPGHHLQIALTQELDKLPEFRRNLYVNAFGEGWGLYAEYLGEEMGIYDDPYSKFGRLTYEMWRACRLVIDVGLHAKGWTRDQAIQYLAEHTALSIHEVTTEINRYISWPGQALAYKMGELKIKELRKKTEEALKEKFDVREFHDLILSQGTVTLAIMEKMVDNYIAARTGEKSRKPVSAR